MCMHAIYSSSMKYLVPGLPSEKGPLSQSLSLTVAPHLLIILGKKCPSAVELKS